MTNKEELFGAVDAQKEALWSMNDQIHDNPEYEGNEVFAAGLLTDYLKAHGFEVEMGVGGYKTAFRGTFQHGEGGPVIGILTEYDALRGLGHGCGHNLQGPGCLGRLWRSVSWTSRRASDWWFTGHRPRKHLGLRRI